MFKVISNFNKLSNPEVVIEINDLASMFEYTKCIDINSLYKRAISGMLNLQDFGVINPEIDMITDTEYRRRLIEDYDVLHFSDDPLVDLSNLNNNLSRVASNLNKRKFVNLKNEDKDKLVVKKEEENKEEENKVETK